MWFVSRTAYDAVCSERDYLRERVNALQDDVARLSRASNGLPELKPTPRKPLPPMPAEVSEEIALWEGQHVQENLTMQAKRLAQSHGWDEALHRLRAERLKAEML